MAKQRSIKDLYVRGKVVTLDDGNGELKFWVQKLNPIEHSQCMKKADAARARALACVHDKDSDDYQAAVADVSAADFDTLVSILSAIERGRISSVVAAEVESEDKWSKDNYIKGLREAWDDLEDTFIMDEDDKEAKRVHDELERYTNEVQKTLDERIELHEDGLKSLTEPELREIAVEQNIKMLGDVTWISEFSRQEVYFATRKYEDHSVRVFDSRADIDELQAEAYGALAESIRELMVDPVEGKDLAVNPPSSISSEQSEKEEIPVSSGQNG